MQPQGPPTILRFDRFFARICEALFKEHVCYFLPEEESSNDSHFRVGHVACRGLLLHR